MDGTSAGAPSARKGVGEVEAGQGRVDEESELGELLPRLAQQGHAVAAAAGAEESDGEIAAAARALGEQARPGEAGDTLVQ